MIIKLFDKEITIRDKYCNFFNNEGSQIEEPYINLYVRFKSCNANCLFCEFKEIANSFNITKYIQILEEFNKNNIPVRKLSFTGGEPTLNFNRFVDVITITKQTLPTTFIVLNTNGIYLTKLFNNDIINSIDNIALSKHHYIDKINNQILGFKSISSNHIKEFQQTNRRDKLLHFSCNLIKNFIDSDSKIIKFLEKTNKLDVSSVGFVSLLPVNAYCKENFIDFKDLNLNNKFFNSKQFTDVGFCECCY